MALYRRTGKLLALILTSIIAMSTLVFLAGCTKPEITKESVFAEMTDSKTYEPLIGNLPEPVLRGEVIAGKDGKYFHFSDNTISFSIANGQGSETLVRAVLRSPVKTTSGWNPVAMANGGKTVPIGMTIEQVSNTETPYAAIYYQAGSSGRTHDVRKGLYVKLSCSAAEYNYIYENSIISNNSISSEAYGYFDTGE